jgi:regulator of sirC expression with transglutaminase-like and TPR domain
MEDNKTIIALIQLLDDPDELVFNHVHQQLLAMGEKVIPVLETSWEIEIKSTEHQTRIENLIHEIQFLEIQKKLLKWKNSEEKDLIDGWLLVSKWKYPGIDFQLIKDKINQIKQDIWIEINQQQTAYEKIKILNRIFFNQYKFKGNQQNYTSPLNSYINTVLETKHGNPLSLGILYSYISQKLDIPIYGVNLPNHFILAYLDENNVNTLIGNNTNSGVLFYINVFSNGVILYEDDVKTFLNQIKIKEQTSYFEPCGNSIIIQRIITNLISTYQSNGNIDYVNELTQLKNILVN